MNAVKNTYPAIRTLEGAGFEVRRPLPSAAIGSVGPFILLDHMGPTVVEPLKAVGAPTHPHAGIETITVIFEGGGHHKDSLGNVSTTGPGEVQWMRAGAGIIHDEGPSDEILKNGGRSHGAQLWLDMPGDKKFVAPDYRHLRLDDIPVLS
ncbi:MAG: pirin family protein, partial [Pseudomonadota bacterium]